MKKVNNYCDSYVYGTQKSTKFEISLPEIRFNNSLLKYGL